MIPLCPMGFYKTTPLCKVEDREEIYVSFKISGPKGILNNT